MLLDMKLSKFSLSPMSQSVTSTKSSPFGPAVSEQSLRSLKETAGSEPRQTQVMGSLCYSSAGNARNYPTDLPLILPDNAEHCRLLYMEAFGYRYLPHSTWYYPSYQVRTRHITGAPGFHSSDRRSSYFSVELLSSAMETALTLANTPLDLQIAIYIFLHPSDILALHKVCHQARSSLLSMVV